MTAPRAVGTTDGPRLREESRVLVTGGCGFVGRAVVHALVDAGAEVVVLDRTTWTGPPGAPEGVLDIVGDVTDPDAVDQALDHEPDAVVHLAAETSVLRSVDRPAETFATNVVGTQELMEGVRRHHVPQVVMASTNAVTGAAVGGATPSPLTPYGATKAAGEMLLRGHAHAYGIAGSVLRFSNIYGPGMAGKDSFVPRLVRAARDGRAVAVHGDGHQVRDLLHVRDAAAAVLAALATGHDGTVSVGSGVRTSVLDLVAVARRVTGAPLPAHHVEAPPGEMPAVVVDPAPAREVLGFGAVEDLEHGVGEVWDELASSAVPTAP